MQKTLRLARSITTALVIPLILSGCLIDDVDPPAVTPVNNPGSTNRAPVLTGNPPQVIRVGVAYLFQPASSDADADPLVFTVENQPIWTEFDATTGRLSGIPFLGSEGTYAGIMISANDGTTSTSLPAFTISVESVTAPNMPPEIDGIPAGNVTIGNSYTFAPTASDPDGDLLTFSAENIPAWASFDTTSGMLSGTPQASDIGAFADISISVSDATSSASLPAFSIQVSDQNAAPSISGTAQTQITAGQAYVFTPVATDPNADALSFSAQNLPLWLNLDENTGTISGTPQSGDVGNFPGISISVTDGMLSASLAAFSIDVNATNSPPTISGTPDSQVVVAQNYSFAPTALDADGDAMTFAIQNLPTWMTFDQNTGALAGTPSDNDLGTFAGIVISASDGALTASLPAFSIDVSAANNAPSISGTPTSQIVAGQAYSFTPTAMDEDGNALTFSIQNQPGWLTFDAASGALSGTPAAGDAGTYTQIMISVSDGSLTADLSPFAIDVTAANSAPTIGGTPQAQIAVGNAYTFSPDSADVDGDTLVFSIQNAPAWTSFDPATGTLSGTPQAGDEGIHADIRITVSDGSLNAQLPAFSIEVMAISMGSATLSWTPPTLNSDGSPLTDLASYIVYYGTAPTAMNTQVPLNNAGLTSYVVENLSPATYYFSITSVNSAGVESTFSNTASKTIN